MTVLAGMELLIDLDFQKIEIQAVEDYLKNVVSLYAKPLYRQDVEIHVHLIEGSINAKIILVGAIYTAICQYGSFRSGIDHIINDSKILKEIVVSELIKNGLNASDILDTKKLYCTPEKIRRVLLKIDTLENNLTNLTEEDYKKELSKIRTSVENIYLSISTEQDRELFVSSLREEYIPEQEKISNKKYIKKILAREEDIQVKIPLVSKKILLASTVRSSK